MHFDSAVVADLTVSIKLTRWLRVMPAAHMKTPLGRGFGASRWSSRTRAFKVIYVGQQIETSLAETIIRDRFEAISVADRILNLSEVLNWAIAEVHSKKALNLLDLTSVGPLRMGLDTDAVGAKAHLTGQEFSDALHAEFPELDGIMYLSRLTRGRCVAVYDRSIEQCLTADPAIGLACVRSLRDVLEGLSVTLNDDLT